MKRKKVEELLKKVVGLLAPLSAPKVSLEVLMMEFHVLEEIEEILLERMLEVSVEAEALESLEAAGSLLVSSMDSLSSVQGLCSA